jgi:formate dehydrogenase subunit gamma
LPCRYFIICCIGVIQKLRHYLQATGEVQMKSLFIAVKTGEVDSHMYTLDDLMPGRLVRLAMVVVIMVFGMLVAGNQPIYAEATGSPQSNAPYRENTLSKQSDSDLWSALKQGRPGLATTKRAEDSVAINTDGVWWAQLRQSNGPLIRYGAAGVLAVIGILSLFFMLRGRLKIEGGRSHNKVARFSVTHRVVHWGIAVLFLLLAFTGLVLLFGRPVLIPVIGKTAYSALATASMQTQSPG